MNAYFCKLIPPRPTFAQDMDEAEAKIMQEHSSYWENLLPKGQVVAYGLVADPSGPWGVCLLEVENESVARHLTDNDPALKSGRGFRYEIYGMPLGVRHP